MEEKKLQRVNLCIEPGGRHICLLRWRLQELWASFDLPMNTAKKRHSQKHTQKCLPCMRPLDALVYIRHIASCFEGPQILICLDSLFQRLWFSLTVSFHLSFGEVLISLVGV